MIRSTSVDAINKLAWPTPSREPDYRHWQGRCHFRMRREVHGSRVRIRSRHSLSSNGYDWVVDMNCSITANKNSGL